MRRTWSWFTRLWALCLSIFLSLLFAPSSRLLGWPRPYFFLRIFLRRKQRENEKYHKMRLILFFSTCSLLQERSIVDWAPRGLNRTEIDRNAKSYSGVNSGGERQAHVILKYPVAPPCRLCWLFTSVLQVWLFYPLVFHSASDASDMELCFHSREIVVCRVAWMMHTVVFLSKVGQLVYATSHTRVRRLEENWGLHWYMLTYFICVIQKYVNDDVMGRGRLAPPLHVAWFIYFLFAAKDWLSGCRFSDLQIT